MKCYEVTIKASATYEVVALDEGQAYELAMKRFDNDSFAHASIDVEVERSCDPDDL